MEDIQPEEDALILCRSDDAMMPPVDLIFYNNTGTGPSDYHYDPVHMRQDGQRLGQTARRISEAASASEKKPRTSSKLAIAEFVKKPHFVNLSSNPCVQETLDTARQTDASPEAASSSNPFTSVPNPPEDETT